MIDNQEIRRLSVAERLLLVEEIWDSIAADQGSVPVSTDVKQELGRRLAEHRNDPAGVLDWQTVKTDLERRLR